jgi:hypothetical protein
MEIKNPEWQLELEESAEGVELYHTPGSELQVEKARDQAEASGWIPETEESGARRLTNLERARLRRGELRRAMEHMETTIARPASAEGWARNVELAARQLMVALFKHVKDVESGEGLLAEIVRQAPRLGSEAETMKEEHQALIESTRGLRAILNAQGGPDAMELRTAVLTILGELALHRQHGSDLVYDAYNIDIAASD